MTIIINTIDTIQNKKQRIIQVGSSMGAWISIHIAFLFNNNSNENMHVNNLKHGKNQTVYIDGIIGIAGCSRFYSRFMVTKSRSKSKSQQSRRQ